MVDNDFDSGVLIGPLAFVVREHEAHRAALKGGLSVAVGGVYVVGDQAARNLLEPYNEAGITILAAVGCWAATGVVFAVVVSPAPPRVSRSWFFRAQSRSRSSRRIH